MHSPTVPGATDRVERVIDAIAFLARKHPLEFNVAARIRRAYDLVGAEIGGAADFDRVRSSPQPGPPPPVARLDAARLLADLNNKIPGLDDVKHALIALIVCKNYTISSVARMGVTRYHGRDWYGTELRKGLRAIAEHWGWTEERARNSQIRASRASGYSTDSTEIIPGTVVHATGKRVFRTKR